MFSKKLDRLVNPKPTGVFCPDIRHHHFDQFGFGMVTLYIFKKEKNVGIPGNNISLFSRTKHVNTCSIKRVSSQN